MLTEEMQGRLELYQGLPPAAARFVPYTVEPLHTFSERERQALEEALDVGTNPYTDYGAYLAEVRELARTRVPAFFRELMEEARRQDLRERPVLYFKNCPTGNVPELDYDDPLTSKYERKTDFVAEAFHSVFSELHGTGIVTYRSANRGDMFHDITPMRKLAYSLTQKTLNTLHFHRDLPDNKVRPDWVYLLSLRNSAKNLVFTPVVRLKDVFEQLDAKTLEALRKPLFAAPRPVEVANINEYGRRDGAYYEKRPMLVKFNGYETLMYHEGCHEAFDDAGREAIARLREVLHRNKHDLFLQERDFVAIGNNSCMHARHVVAINDPEQHKRRWVMKTWVVNDLEQHRQHFIPGRIHTSDE